MINSALEVSIMKYQINQKILEVYKTLQGMELTEEECDRHLDMQINDNGLNRDVLSQEEKEVLIEESLIEELKGYGYKNLEEMIFFLKEKGFL